MGHVSTYCRDISGSIIPVCFKWLTPAIKSVQLNLGDFNHTARCLYSAPITNRIYMISTP